MKTQTMIINDMTYTISETELLFHVRKFIERISNDIPQEYLCLLKNNLPSLKIKHSTIYKILHDGFKLQNYEMNYNVKKNKIKYHSDYIYRIYYSLFLVASTNIGEDGLYQGLSKKQNNDSKWIGRGLTKGYTWCLMERYFYDENKGEFFGKNEKTKKIMSEIESLLGHDVVLNCYMNANMDTFQELLLEYGNSSEVLYFISLMDELYDAESKQDYVKIGKLYNQVSEVLHMFITNSTNKKLQLQK